MLQIIPAATSKTTWLSRPLFSTGIPAGYPHPAEDEVEAYVDLNHDLIVNPATTFYIRVFGDSMRGVGINNNDLLIADRSIEARDGDIVIALVDGEFTVKRLKVVEEGVHLVPENPNYKILKVRPPQDFQVWGIVTYVIHSVR